MYLCYKLLDLIILSFEGFLIGNYETPEESYLLGCDAMQSGRF
jgi:hypothetical protein